MEYRVGMTGGWMDGSSFLPHLNVTEIMSYQNDN